VCESDHPHGPDPRRRVKIDGTNDRHGPQTIRGPPTLLMFSFREGFSAATPDAGGKLGRGASTPLRPVERALHQEATVRRAPLRPLDTSRPQRYDVYRTVRRRLHLPHPRYRECRLHIASGCVVECRICNREVAGSNLSLGYFAPRSTQLSISPGSVNEYQL